MSIDWHKIIDHIPAHIAVIEKNGKIVYLNRSLTDFIISLSGKISSNIEKIQTNYSYLCEALFSDQEIYDKIQAEIQRISADRNLSGIIETYGTHFGQNQKVMIQLVPDHTKSDRILITHILFNEQNIKQDLIPNMLYAVDASTHAVQIMDTRGLSTYHNFRFQNLFGYSVEELNQLGGVSSLFCSGEIAKHLLNTVSQDATFIGDAELCTNRGKTFIGKIKSYPVKDQSGRITGFTAIYIDITKRTISEIALKESEAKYRALVEKIPAITYIMYFARPIRIEYISPQVHGILGFTPSDFAKRPSLWIKQIHKDDKKKVLFKRNKSIKNKISFRSEYRIWTREGTLKWVRDEASVVRDNTGVALFMQGFVFDITEQKKTVDALRSSEIRFRTLVQNIHEYIYSIIYPDDKKDSPITYHSPKSFEMTGYHPQEYYINPNLWFEMIYIEDKQIVQDFFRKLENSGGSDTIEHRIISKKGEVRWVSNTCSAQTDETGKLKRLDGFILDITARKKLENELVQTTLAAEKANSLKSQFLATMSHEIRTPMHGVLGLTEILSNTTLDPVQKEYIKMIRASGENLMHLLDDILDFSKIEAGKIILESENFEFRQIMRNVLNPLHIRANEKELSFFINIDNSIPTYLNGDPHRLSQVLINLISNAINYTEQGSVEVEAVLLDSERKEKGKSTKPRSEYVIRFNITDTGIGIPENKKSIIFESFRQADESFTRKYGGTGLGTAISSQLVELMGGQIGFISPSPKKNSTNPGTQFWFEVPFQSTDTTDTITSEQTDEDPNMEIAETQSDSLKILVVEDHEINQMIIHTMLENLGHQVILASDGVEGVECAKKEYFDLILMDLQMPNMDGFEATVKMKNELKLDTPIYAVTADAYKEDLDRCNEIGMQGYVIKPYKQEELEQIIASIQTQKQEEDD